MEKSKLNYLIDVAPKSCKKIQRSCRERSIQRRCISSKVIDGFMAQTGDVKFGNKNNKDYNLQLAGTGGSDLPNVNAEFSDTAHVRGVFLLRDHQIQIVLIVNFSYVWTQRHI